MTTENAECVTKVKPIVFSQLLTLGEFKKMLEKKVVGDVVHSDIFGDKRAPDVYWQLFVYPNGKTEENKGNVSILVKMTGNKDVIQKAEYRFYFLDDYNNKKFSHVKVEQFELKQPNGACSFGVMDMKRETAVENVRSNHSLKVLCEVEILPDLATLVAKTRKSEKVELPKTVVEHEVDSDDDFEIVKKTPPFVLTQKWTIKDYESLQKLTKTGECIRSVPFKDSRVPHVCWQLCIYPAGKKEQDKKHISLFLKMATLDRSKHVRLIPRFTFELLDDYNMAKYRVTNVGDFEAKPPKGGHSWGLKAIPWSKGNPCIRGDKSLVISCEIEIHHDFAPFFKVASADDECFDDDIDMLIDVNEM